jgi:hypothetical protein
MQVDDVPRQVECAVVEMLAEMKLAIHHQSEVFGQRLAIARQLNLRETVVVLENAAELLRRVVFVECRLAT